MNEMTRRTFGICSLVGLSGCQRSSGTTRTSIGTIELLNERRTDQTFHVLVEAGDDVVFWKTVQVTGSEDGSIHVVDVDGDLPQGLSGSLRIHARVGEQWDSTAIDDECSYVGIWAETTSGTESAADGTVAIRVDTGTNCS
jgi:hypothetical protein